MPPVDISSIEWIEQATKIMLRGNSPAQALQPESLIIVPDDIRAVALFGLVAAIDAGQPEEPALRQTRTHMQSLYNLEGFIQRRDSGLTESELYEHQHDVFDSIYDFLANPPLDETGNFQRKGYIKMPTGTGKTGIFTTLIDVINKPIHDDEPKLKTLTLVPKLDLVDQTVGQNQDGNTRGFTKFANDTSVTEYHGHRKDLSGDAVVMTYRSFNQLVKAGKLDKDMFDIVILDEVHNGLGPQVKESIQSYTSDKLVIGLTASPDYADNKKVSDILPVEIHSMELREAIEEGFLSPVQCLAIASDAEIETVSQFARDFTEQELEKLIEHEWRNTKAVEFATNLVSEGKQGLVACVPGQNLAHARLIAENLQNTIITDSNTGERRPIRAVAVGGDTKERQTLYEAYERGEIDVLAYVDLLTEGWDSSMAKFLINLRPTTSPVNATQRLGRILRPLEGETAIVVEFIDKSDKPQYTFYHALGVEEIELGTIYGKDRGDSEGGSPLDITTLPDEIQELLKDIDHRLIGELIIQPIKYELPEGVMSIKKFADSLGVGTKTIMNFIEELGVEPGVYQFGDNRMEGLGLTAEQQALISLHEFFEMPVADDAVKSIFAFSEESGLGRGAITKAVEALGLELTNYRFDNNMTGFPALTNEQQAQVTEYIFSNAKQADESIISLNEFVKNSNTSRDTVLRLAEELGIDITTYVQPNGVTLIGLSSSECQRILEHSHFQVPEFSEEYVSVQALIKELKMQRPKLQELMDEVGVALQQVRRGGNRSLALTASEADQLREYITVHMPSPPQGVISINEFAQQYSLGPHIIKELINELGLTLNNYRFVAKRGARIAPGLDATSIDAISQHPKFIRITTAEAIAQRITSKETPRSPAKKVQPVQLPVDLSVPEKTEEITTVYRLAKELNISEQRIKDMADELGLELRIFRKSNNKVITGILPDQQAAIRQHPYFQQARATTGDVTLNQAARALGSDPSSLRKVLTQSSISTRSLVSADGRTTDHISIEELEHLKTLPRFHATDLPEGAKSTYTLAKDLHIGEKTLAIIMTELGIEPSLYKVPRGKSFSITSGLTQDQQQLVNTHTYFSIEVAPDDVTSAAVLAKELHASTPYMVKIALSLGITPQEYRFGSGKVSLGFTAEQRLTLAQALQQRR